MKKIYLLPNLITTANLVFGFLAIVHSFKGEFVRACWFIVIGAICDSLDGRVARMAKATSPFGVQYDSLADLTSFGIAPGVILFAFSLHDLSRFGVSVAAFYCICAALRLARFNVSAEDPSPDRLRKIRKGYFQGLPSPVSAGMIVVTVLMQTEFQLIPDELLKYFMLALGLLLALLMVSNIPFPSFKEVNWRTRGKAWILLIPLVFILSVIQVPELTLFLTGFVYLLASLSWAGYLRYIRDRNAVQI
jgi:CDP-diacylglycerol--serine O-phosphatidyltransferase